jgi:hypothetical protein
MCLSRKVPIAACKREHRPVFWAEQAYKPCFSGRRQHPGVRIKDYQPCRVQKGTQTGVLGGARVAAEAMSDPACVFLAGTASDGRGGRDPDAGAGSSDGSGEILGLKGARAGAEAALAGRFRYPEPVYHVVRGYPELQTQEAPAPSSRILPSQERYRGVWCARAFFG